MSSFTEYKLSPLMELLQFLPAEGLLLGFIGTRVGWLQQSQMETSPIGYAGYP